MNNLWYYALVFSFLIPALLYDSDFVRSLSVPHPFIFFSFGLVAVLSLLALLRGRVRISSSIKNCVLIFYAVILQGLAVSLALGGSSLLAAGSKALTILIAVSLLVFGHSLGAQPEKAASIGRIFIVFSVVAVAVILLRGTEGFNQNWLALSLLFSAATFSLTCGIGDRVAGLLLATISFVAFLALASRGVAIASGLGALILILGSSRYLTRPNRFLFRLAFFVVPLFGIASAFAGVALYRSAWYSEAVTFSIQYTGKHLDANRLRRWDLALELIHQRPILGWGIDAHIVRASQNTHPGLGDLHNFWLEVGFRLGLVGVIAYLAIFFLLARRLSARTPQGRTDFRNLALFYVYLVLTNVYALGGFTHWPGTFLFWFVIGLMLSRSECADPRPRAMPTVATVNLTAPLRHRRFR